MISEVESLDLQERVDRFGRILSGCAFTGSRKRPMTQKEGLRQALRMLSRVREKDGSVFIVGNGGSAAIASHVVTDFVNTAGFRAFTLHDPSLLTCMANDYGYEEGYARALSLEIRSRDLLIAISSSGKSRNIRNAASTARRSGAGVITFSGFDAHNPLRAMGDINVWLDARNYGDVEVGHQFLLHVITDHLMRRSTKGRQSHP